MAERVLQGRLETNKQARRDGEMRRGGEESSIKTRGKQASKERWRDEMGCGEEPAMKTRGKKARRGGEMTRGRKGAGKED